MTSGKDTAEGGKVVALEALRSVGPDAVLDRVEGYWNTLRNGRLLPSRNEVDPRGLEGVLGYAFILERVTGGLARFRIAGSHMTALAGLELRRMPVSALFTAESRAELAEAMTAVFEEPATARLALRSPGGFGRSQLEGQMLLLPLRSDLGDVSRVLGAIRMSGRIGRTPRRLSIAGQVRRTLIGYSGITEPVFAGPSAETGSAPGSRRTTRRETGSERPYLRLVIAND